MLKGVLAALVAAADSDRHHYYLVHAAEDCLCDWKPTDTELSMLQPEMTSLQIMRLSHPYLQAFVVCYGRHCLNTTNYYAS